MTTASITLNHHYTLFDEIGSSFQADCIALNLQQLYRRILLAVICTPANLVFAIYRLRGIFAGILELNDVK